MVWNDWCDLEQDKLERPFRPLPSGRVSRQAAAKLGTVLLALGFLFATASGLLCNEQYAWRSGMVAGCLLACIVSYDFWLKRMWIGPMVMGCCRLLNVLLGFSLWPGSFEPWQLQSALAVGVYITGVTWFSRKESGLSRRLELLAAGVVMLGGLLIALLAPVWLDSMPELAFPLLLLVAALMIGVPVCRAILKPTAPSVQAAVKRAIFGLVLLDAGLATAFIGLAGLFIALWLVPAMVLGRWVYST
jgi:4-hydroxybenzoate polyprenyltransferase